MKKNLKITNSLKGVKNQLQEIKVSNCITVSFRNDDSDSPAEINLYDEIGKDPWSGSGISATDFQKALNEIPKTKPLNIRINSPGGDVHDGMAIHNLINAWPNKVTAVIDGVAASTASWIPMACDSIEMPETAQMFVHDAMCFTGGNSEDLRQAADYLDTTSNQIAGMYAKKSGKTVEAMRDLMRNETLMTGTQAKDLGLVDVLTKKAAARNFTPAEIGAMKNKLNTLKNSAPNRAGQPKTKNNPAEKADSEIIMNRTQMVALLNKLGIKFEDKATDEQLVALLEKHNPTLPAPVNKKDSDPDVAALQKQVNELTELNNVSRKHRIEAHINRLIGEDKITENVRQESITLALQNEAYLGILDKLPSRPVGTSSIGNSVELTGESFADVQKFIVTNTSGITQKFIGANAGREFSPEVARDITNCHVKAYSAVKKHRNMLTAMFNANTIDANLQRTLILSDMLRDFPQHLLPLSAFAKTYSNVPLEGNDTVAVPYFPNQTAASTNFVAGTGYVTGNTTENSRLVTVNKRKYQAFGMTSYELRRQPYQNWAQLAKMNAEKLGVDVALDVLSVVLKANYGPAVLSIPAAGFSADNLADLSVTATELNWPTTGRSLVLTSAYYGALLKDPGFKYVLNAGSDDALRKAIIKSSYGFDDIYSLPVAALPNNGENLTGFICQLSSVLVATAPIMPAPAVRRLMDDYQIAVDPESGATIEYRYFGNPQLDSESQIVESNYGYNLGVQTALGRIVSSGN